MSLVSAGADQAAESIFARAGDDGFGYVRMAQTEVVLGKMDGITRKLGGRVADLLPLVAQRFLKNPMLAGVDLQRPCTVVFLNPAVFTNNLAIVVGVSDGALFCDSFGKGGVSRVETDAETAAAAIRHFTEPVEEFDQQGFIAALRTGEQPDPAKFKKQTTKHYYVTVRDGEGVIVGDRSLLEQPRTRGRRMAGAIKGDITAACRVPSLLACYEKNIREQQQAVQMLMQAAAGRAGGQTGGDAALRRGRLFAAGIGGVLGVARQVEWIEAGLELNAGQLRGRIALRPVAGTLLARTLAGQSPAPLDAGVMSLLPADTAVLSYWQTVRTPETIEFYAQYLQPILQAAAPTNAAATVSLGDIMRESMEAQAGAMGMALKPPPDGGAGFDLLQAYRVKDPARAREAQRKAATVGVQALGGFFSEMETGRMRYESAVANHAGVEIDQMSLELEPGVVATSRAAAQNLFGSNLVSQVAFAGQFGLAATGIRSAENIRQLINLARKPPTNPAARPRFDAATAAFPKRVNGVFFMQVEDYFRMVAGAMPAAMAADGGRLHELLDRVQADIAGFLVFARDAATAEMVVPLDKLLELSRSAPPKPAEP